MAAAICCLFVLNVYRSYSLGQSDTMYDNPIYRWRVSVAVALSELRNPPTKGYVAYGSIVNYLNQHGLALMQGEASPMPTYQSVRALVYDSARLDKLFQKASSAPIDYNLAAVPIIGNEKGEAAFYYWAFRLFGIHITSMWYLYFVLLGVSVLMFFLRFWQSRICMLLLMAYLVGHVYMIDIATISWYQTVHNSRFLPVLALLPSMHLALVILRRTPPRLASVTLAIGQTFLLFFVIFNRLEAAWQPAAILVLSATVLPLREILSQPSHSRLMASRVSKALILSWPGILVLAGAIALVTYQHLALDTRAYVTETRTHTFWEPLLSGTISASPELMSLYSMGQPAYSDTMGYFIARKYVIDHNDTASPIAVLKDGVIVGTNALNDMGAYDAILRRVFFQLLKHHPWLVLKSFLYDKPRAALAFFIQSGDLYRPLVFLWSLLLAVACGCLVSAFGTPVVRPQHILTTIRVGSLIAIFSLSSIFIFPTTVIPDTILYFLILLLMGPAFVPLLVRQWMTRASYPSSPKMKG